MKERRSEARYKNASQQVPDTREFRYPAARKAASRYASCGRVVMDKVPLISGSCT